jgi:hypothetical protein
MAFFGALVFAEIIWATMLWGSIKIVDRNNQHNSFAAALFWAGLNLVVSLVLREIALLGLVMALAYLVLMVRVLMNTYELGLLRALAVLALLIAAPYLLMPPLVDFVGDSELRGVVVLYGLPLGILAVWGWSRFKAREVVADDSPLPRARVVKRAEPAPAASPAAPVPRAPTAPVAPPAAPIQPVAAVAPTAEVPASPEGGPKFLR